MKDKPACDAEREAGVVSCRRLYTRGMMGLVLMTMCSDLTTLPTSGYAPGRLAVVVIVDAALTALFAFLIAACLFRPIARRLRQDSDDSPALLAALDRLPFRSAMWAVIVLVLLAVFIAASELAKHGALEVVAWVLMLIVDYVPDYAVYAYCVGWRAAFQARAALLPRSQTDPGRRFSFLGRLGVIAVVLVLGNALYGVFSEAVLTNFPKAVIDGYPARGFWPNLDSFLCGAISLVLILWQLRPVGERSIQDILDALRTFRTDRLHVRVPVVEDNEFGYIAESFNELADHIEDRVQERTRELQEAHAELSRRYEDLQNDLALAKAVQLSLIREGVEISECEAAIRYAPMIGIGGDYAWAQPLDERQMFVAVCDVSGHGIAASLLSNRIHVECVHLVEQGCEPHEVLAELNQFALPLMQDGGFFSFFAAVIDTGKGFLRYAGAGHPPLILVRPHRDECACLDSQGTLLGILEEPPQPWRSDDADFSPGDAILLYSDGIIEAADAQGRQLGIEGLVQIGMECAALAPQKAADALMDRYRQHLAGEAQDDVSLILAKRFGPRAAGAPA